jgi:hypothetical protein
MRGLALRGDRAARPAPFSLHEVDHERRSPPKQDRAPKHGPGAISLGGSRSAAASVRRRASRHRRRAHPSNNVLPAEGQCSIFVLIGENALHVRLSQFRLRRPRLDRAVAGDAAIGQGGWGNVLIRRKVLKRLKMARSGLLSGVGVDLDSVGMDLGAAPYRLGGRRTTPEIGDATIGGPSPSRGSRLTAIALRRLASQRIENGAASR